MSSSEKRRGAPPLRRQDLEPALVTDADSVTVRRYLSRRSETPAIWGLEQSANISGAPAALADTFNVLLSSAVGVKPEDSVKPAQRYWRGILDQSMETSPFEALRGKTRGDELLSTIGTLEAANTVFGLVPKQDKEKLDKLAQAQAEADEFEADAQKAEMDAQAFQDLLAQMQAAVQTEDGAGQGSGQPQPGQPSVGQAGGKASGKSSSGSAQMSAEQAQQIADQLTKAQNKAAEARELADAAQEELQAKADALMGKPGTAEAEAKLDELRRLGRAAMQQANETVGEVRDTVAAWGVEAGEIANLDPTEAMALLERMKSNQHFKKFAELLGRLRRAAEKKARMEEKGKSTRVPRIHLGRDIGRALLSEVAAFAMGDIHEDMVTERWARGTLRQRGAVTKRQQSASEGPMVICEDASGSMAGEPYRWAKAVTLALATLAREKKRGYGWVMFDERVQRSRAYPAGKLGARDILEIAETAATGGGTNFEAPLLQAKKMIDEEGLEKADIVLITDGDCAVSQQFLEKFLAWKQERSVTVISVVINVGSYACSTATVDKFSDRVERVSSFTAEAAEAQVFAHL